jgi:ribose 5-phosphate isomerase A
MIHKKQAALKAIEYVKNGMILGLGSGSTNQIFLSLLGEKISSGEIKDVLGVPTSSETAHLAESLGIQLTNLTNHPRIDLAVDGADEVDPQLNLIKGLGKALLREKIVEIHSNSFLVIVDESKMVSKLATHAPLPVELVQFEADTTIRWLNTLGCEADYFRVDDELFVTDNGNYYAHCWYKNGIEDPYSLARTLNERPGIVEHGLFLDMASEIIVAGPSGIKILERK